MASSLFTSIDHLTIPSRCGKGLLHRISEVFDCWFESGSMPYAQIHYPFENKREFEDAFPADFIAEGIDQTRGWYVSCSLKRFYIYLFIYLFLAALGLYAARGLSLVVASGDYSLRCAGFSLRWLLFLRSMGSGHAGFSSCDTRA